jgi:hypothetical protein
MRRTRSLIAALLATIAAPAAAQFDGACVDRRNEALRSGLIVGVETVDALTATLVVDEPRWDAMPFKEKVALGETVECALIRDTSPAGADLVVRSHLTRKVIGNYRTGGTLTVP